MADCTLLGSTVNEPLTETQFFNTTQTYFALTSTSSSHCLIVQYGLPSMKELCRRTVSSDCSSYQIISDATTTTGTLLPTGSTTQGPATGADPAQQIIPQSFPSPAPAPAPAPPQSSSSKISTGAIIGAAVGGVVVVIVALALLIMYRRKSRQRRGGAAVGRKRLGSGLNVFEDGEEEGGEKNSRPGHQQARSRESSDGTLVQVQDRSLGGGPSYHIPPLPANSPLFKATPTANPTSQQPPMTTAATAASFGRNVSPPPLGTIDYKPRSTYQPPVQQHHHAGPGNKINRDEGGQNDYIDLIPVEDTPQISHAVLPTDLALNRDKGKARAMDIEEEYEDPESERRSLLILGGASSGSQPQNQQREQEQEQQQKLQHQNAGGRPMSVAVEEEDDDEEIKYL